MLFNKKEVSSLVVCIIVLSIVFGFDDGAKTFVLNNWIKNFFNVMFLAAVALLVHVLVLKYFAYRHECRAEFNIWCIRRYGLRRWQKIEENKTFKLLNGFPLGILIALFVSLLSNGLLFFTAIFDNELTSNRLLRSGRKHQEIGGYEEAIVQLSGPLANIALMVIAVAAGSFLNNSFGMFITINFFIALLVMLPFSSLGGAKIFFGSRNLYVFGLLVILLAFILKGAGLIGAIVLTVLLALLLTCAYYFLWENG